MAAPPNFPPALADRLPHGAAPRDPDNPNPRRSSPPRGSPQDLLFRAAFNGNLRLVKRCRSIPICRDGERAGRDEGRGAEKVRFMRDGNGLGPLHIATARAKLPVCRYLIEELRLDVNSISEAGLTPLTCAIDGGSVDVVRYLLDNGSDTETLICTGLTPLVYAVGKGNCEIVQALLNKGAYIDALTTVGAALHFAAHNGRDDMVKILLDNHADAMNLDPDDATLFSNRSLCWLRLGDGKKALTDAVACKSMKPGWSKACYREGAAQMLLKDYEKACGAFLDGLKLEPENAEIESALCWALESLKISRNNKKE